MFLKSHTYLITDEVDKRFRLSLKTVDRSIIQFRFSWIQYFCQACQVFHKIDVLLQELRLVKYDLSFIGHSGSNHSAFYLYGASSMGMALWMPCMSSRVSPDISMSLPRRTALYKVLITGFLVIVSLAVIYKCLYIYSTHFPDKFIEFNEFNKIFKTRKLEYLKVLKCFIQTHLLSWPSHVELFNIRWYWCLSKSPITVHPTLSSNGLALLGDEN